MGFSRQEYWGGLPFPSANLPDLEIEPGSPTVAGRRFKARAREAHSHVNQATNNILSVEDASTVLGAGGTRRVQEEGTNIAYTSRETLLT